MRGAGGEQPCVSCVAWLPWRDYNLFMTQLLADSSLAQKLAQLLEPVEVIDTGGRVLGRFFPKLDPTQFDLEPRITNEELDRRQRSNQATYSTAQVLAYLEKLK